MSNLGIVLSHLGSSQMVYEAINLANKANDAVIFFEQLTTACIPINCASMCVTEMNSFGGVLITTNIENTLMANKVINRNKTRIIFYVWDLEWLRPNKQNYLYNLQAYNTADELVARNIQHVEPIHNYCNRWPKAKKFNEVIKC